MHSSGPVFTRPRVYPPAPQSLQPIYFNHGRPTCLFRRKLPGPCVLVFLRITGSFLGFFVLFLVDKFRDSRNIIISTFWPRSVCSIFKLTGRTRIEQSAGKQFACNMARGRPWIITLMKNYILRP